VTTHKAKKASKPSSSGRNQNQNPTNPGQTPAQFIMNDVKLLFSDLTTPETGVVFNPPSRANPATIRNNINPPTWIWANQAARQSQIVTRDGVGNYGLQTDVNVAFQLSAANPAVWQPIQTGSNATWTWANLTARTKQVVAQIDVGKYGIQTDIQTLYQLTSPTPPVWKTIPNGTNTSSPFELSKGASDADSYHDFFRLQIAFEEIWVELINNNIRATAESLFAKWNALMDQSLVDTGEDPNTGRLKVFSPDPTNASGTNPVSISGADELGNFITSLKAQLGIGSGGTRTSQISRLTADLNLTLAGCNMLLDQLNRVGNFGNPYPGDSALDGSWMSDLNIPGFPPTTRRQDVFNYILNNFPTAPVDNLPDPLFPDIANLLNELDTMLKEKYLFDVFAPDSINFGLLLNYRQHWQPQSYQVGNLVSSIPLAPQEIRRYTTKTVVKKTRNIKEIDDTLQNSKDESSNTSRVDSEIVDRAKNQTNFQKNASGSFGNDNLYKVSAGMQQTQDQAVESAQTRREFHESVVKSAQEYRNDHRTEISTEEIQETETTSYQEIRNPNDELTVTYLFYELQRRYLVDEALHKVTPVILVANDVPAPHEVDQAWILRYDWIIKRTILDKSFLPALEYLSANYTGEEITLEVLELAVEQQKSVVDKISQQVQAADDALDSATVGLVNVENQDVADQQKAAEFAQIKSVFDPIGLGPSGKTDGNADRARVDYAKDALNRAQTKANQLVSQLKTETTALQVAIDKYTKAATKHFTMLADIDRLRIHVKDNIIYYMQVIWTYEPADQRYFRLYNLDVPTFSHNTTVPFAAATGIAKLDPAYQTMTMAFPIPTQSQLTKKLHQVADIENLMGFKGNYMIFPMAEFDYMTWFLMHNYISVDPSTGVIAQDPDPMASLTIEQLTSVWNNMTAANPNFTAQNQQYFEEIMTRLLSARDPEMVIVPSTSLYIEALPGTHPLLEDFKLVHRAIDIKKAQAEVRHAELENLRLAARLSNNEFGDPDIDKVVVVDGGANITVDAGQ
jgi:hypothetical protein